MTTIADILKPEELKSITSSKEHINWLNSQIKTKSNGKPGIECIVRGKNVESDDGLFELKPEEVVRQLQAKYLIDQCGYKKEQLNFEVPVITHGRSRTYDSRVDIAVMDLNKPSKYDIIIEVKRPEVTDVYKESDSDQNSPFEQMKDYCNQKHPEIGCLVNGANIKNFYSCDSYYENRLEIDDYPMNGENLEEWKENQRFTIKQLMQNDRLENETLKNVIKQVEQRFAANDSSDKSFEEIFKLIFLKLYDEISSSKNADEIAILMKHKATRLQDIDDSSFRVMEFRVHENESLDDLFKRISNLFEDAKKKWPGIFPDKSKIDMQPETLKSCIRELQNVKLFNSNLEVVDDAFEYLVNKNQKEEMGQYFTPRYIIDMCVKMLNPHENEKMIDTAAGSCGFPMHTIFNVWQKINPDSNNLFTTTERSNEELEYVINNVFGIDFSEKSVRVGRMLNIIAGDGHTNVVELNSLDYRKWNKAYLGNRDWQAKYNEGFSKIERLESENSKEKYQSFDFDILMANPPFAGDIDNKEQLEPYKLAHKFEEGKPPKVKNKVGRDVLFIERNLNFLKPGGRMAIVLPQGRFNNSSDKEVRDFICEQCRILAVVGLHGNVFKPHTGTKTSVLFVQKWDDELCPKTDDYPIFFATMQEPSKDNSGDKIYVAEDYVKCTKLTYENIKNEKGKIVALPPEEETLKTEDGNDIFVKDLFAQQYGDVNSHKKWIKDNINFIVKQNRKKEVKKEEISIDEWLSLDKETQKFYKKNPLEGKNQNQEIGLKEWEALSKEEKKFYLESSRVKEWTERVKDTHGHIFVKHDLFNHDPNLENKNPNKLYCQDGIAEAFQEFAKREGLSFFQ